MALLNKEHFDKVIEVGKKAVLAFKDNNLINFDKYSEEAWYLFPEPRDNWNQGYNVAKSFFKQNLELNRLDEAKKWLNRMIECNNSLHLFDSELQFYIGVYEFERKDYKEAYANWQAVVKDAGYRYFESTKPEYLSFYRNPDKYIKNEK